MQGNLRVLSSSLKLIMFKQLLKRGRINQVNIKHHHQSKRHHHNVAEVAPQEEAAAKAVATLGPEPAMQPPLGPPHLPWPAEAEAEAEAEAGSATPIGEVVIRLQIEAILALNVELLIIHHKNVIPQRTFKLATRSISNTWNPWNPTMWKSMKMNLKHTM